MKKKRTWIVIADGARARVITKKEGGNGFEEVENFDLIGDNRPSHEISSDRPGRSYESVGSSRHAIEPATDPHREEKRKFAHRLSDYLDDRRASDAFDQLIVIAAPRTLGDLREAISAPVRNLVVEEIDKDIVKVPLGEMKEALGKIITVAY